MRNLPAGLRRALAVALLGLASGGVALVAWAPSRWIAYQEARLAELEGRMAELRERIAEREQLSAERRLLEAALGDETLFVRAATPALAAAELQGVLSTVIRDQGGELLTVQVLEPVEAPPFVEIGLRLTLRSGLASLVGLLHAIESNRPVMLVRSLQLVAGGSTTEGSVPPLETVIEVVTLGIRA